MRIAQVAPLHESVPPKYYGGTERIVSYLTEELVQQGHDVTLFASADSITTANLYPVVNRALRLDEHCVDRMAAHILLVEKVARLANEFDIVHFHIDYLHFQVSRRQNIKQLTTLHGRLDLPDLFPLYKEFDDMPLVSISNHQRSPLPFARWHATVYNGVPDDLYTFERKRGDYLAFLGRISPEKRVDRAIEIATRMCMPLKIAAKIDVVDEGYFHQSIKPLLNNRLVEYIGEIGEYEKSDFLGNACALLFPIDWPEPFGLAMIESMACGTPVVAFRHGAVPEVMVDGVTGYIVDNLDDAVAAVEKIDNIDRHRCRQVFEERYSARRMVKDYLVAYRTLLDQGIEQDMVG